MSGLLELFSTNYLDVESHLTSTYPTLKLQINLSMGIALTSQRTVLKMCIPWWDCWEEEPDRRPTFQAIVTRLDEMINIRVQTEEVIRKEQSSIENNTTFYGHEYEVSQSKYNLPSIDYVLGTWICFFIKRDVMVTCNTSGRQRDRIGDSIATL
jgi:hypothetical protein